MAVVGGVAGLVVTLGLRLALKHQHLANLGLELLPELLLALDQQQRVLEHRILRIDDFVLFGDDTVFLVDNFACFFVFTLPGPGFVDLATVLAFVHAFLGRKFLFQFSDRYICQDSPTNIDAFEMPPQIIQLFEVLTAALALDSRLLHTQTLIAMPR